MTQDDVGHIFRNTNSQALNVDLISTRYYLRNPNLARTRGMYESLVDETKDLNVTWPVRPNRGVNRGYQNGQLRPDGTLARYTAVSAPTVYRGDRLPARAVWQCLSRRISGNLVSRVILNDDGTTMRAKRAYERAEFLASTDERFRPVWLSSAPDGTLYVVDMYRGIIQYIDLVTKYLNDWIVKHDLAERHSSTDAFFASCTIRRVAIGCLRLRRHPRPRSSTTLSHPNGWWRDSAQQLLVQRRDAVSGARAEEARRDGAPAAHTAARPLDARRHGRASIRQTVLEALDSTSRDVRVSALRSRNGGSADPTSPIVPGGAQAGRPIQTQRFVGSLPRRLAS